MVNTGLLCTEMLTRNQIRNQLIGMLTHASNNKIGNQGMLTMRLGIKVYTIEEHIKESDRTGYMLVRIDDRPCNMYKGWSN